MASFSKNRSWIITSAGTLTFLLICCSDNHLLGQTKATLLVPAKRIVPTQLRPNLLKPGSGNPDKGTAGFPQVASPTQDQTLPQKSNPSKTLPAQTSISLTPAQRSLKLKTRLKKLTTLKLTRLPSGIFESWSAETDPTAEAEIHDGLPPAPVQAILQDDTRFALALTKFKRDFALGNWSEVGDFLDLLPKAEATKLYSLMLNAAALTVRTLPGNKGATSRTDPRALQNPYITFRDVFELAAIRPDTPTEPLLAQYARLFNTVIKRGASVQDLLQMFHDQVAESSAPEQATGHEKVLGKRTRNQFTRRDIAMILMSANLPIEAGEFLPDLEKAKSEDDHEALNLISQFYLAKYATDQKTAELENAWRVTQAILNSPKVEAAERKEALQRAVSLSGKVRAELGNRWLDETFGSDSNRGVETLAGIGADVSRNPIVHPNDTQRRQKQLELQAKAVAAVLGRNTELDKRWQEALELLAVNWLKEARISYDLDSSTQRGPNMKRDMYGNFYYFNPTTQRTASARITPVPINELLKVRPDQAWPAGCGLLRGCQRSVAWCRAE